MKWYVYAFLSVFIISCGSSRVITSKEEQRKYGDKPQPKETVEVPKENQIEVKEVVNTSQPEVGEVPNGSTNKVNNYISMYAAIAQYEMKKTGIPASITLAQGILESGAGQGYLTQRANNHFGIKCHGWKGEKVYHDDDKKQECFRKYNHPRESFHDHSEFLTSRSRYAFLFSLDSKDYKGWARGLRKAGYATDPKYPNKLISLIERYQLYQYDEANIVVEEAESDNSKNDESISSTKEIVNKESNKESKDETHVVRKGDTLYSISKKYGLTVEKLMELNSLNDTSLRLDQELKIK